MELSEDAPEDLVQFVKHTKEAPQLDAFDCSVEVEETTESGHPAVKFTAHLDESEYDEDNTFSAVLQKTADEFYGHHEYVCGVYSDSRRVEVTISPFSLR